MKRRTLRQGQKVTVVRNGRRLPAVVAKTTRHSEEFPFVLVKLDIGSSLLVRWVEIEENE